MQKVSASVARARARARDDDDDDYPMPGQAVRYNSAQDDMPVFRRMKRQFPGLVFQFDDAADNPSYRWQAGVYEGTVSTTVPGFPRPFISLNFRIVAHSRTRKGLVAELLRQRAAE